MSSTTIAQLQHLLTVAGWAPEESNFAVAGLTVQVNSVVQVTVVTPEEYAELSGAEEWHVGVFNTRSGEYDTFAQLPPETPVRQVLGHVLAALLTA